MTDAEHRIRPGQIYQSCQPVFVVDGDEEYVRIKVIGAPVTWTGTYGFGKARVATLSEDGRELRARMIEVSQLHASGTTKTGVPRKTGYRLIKEASDA